MMYQSILKTATNDSDFEFVVNSDLMPITHFSRYQHQHTVATILVFILAVVIGMLLSSISSSIVSERVSGLKHL